MSMLKKCRIAWTYRVDPAAEQFLLQQLWLYALMVFACASIFSVAWGAYIFFIPVNQTQIADSGGVPDAFDREALTQLLARFDERATKHGSLKSTKPTVSDPSKN